MSRLFLGIPMADTLGKTAGELRSAIGSDLQGRFTPANQLHVTLRFLGDVANDAVPAITEALAEIAWQPFTLTTGRLGCFPAAGAPRVAWLAAESPAMARLAADIDRALRPWFGPRDHPFCGHITLARVRRSHCDLRRKLAAIACPTLTCEVRAFLLYSSALSASGATHSPLATFGCAPANRPNNQL